MGEDIGRNDPCWCGSGRKYKRCHLREDEEKRRRQLRDEASEESASSFFEAGVGEEDLRRWARRYDADEGPDPQEWLEHDESEQHRYVAAYHEFHKPHPIPEGARLHYLFHSTVENQLADGDEVVAGTLERLVDEGLSRHQGIHAIANVLSDYIYDLLGDGEVSAATGFEEDYHAELKALTAEKWLALGDE